MARFIHTSDWHLGRLLSGMRLIDDQAHALDGLVQLVEAERPDAVLISGDVYDRAVPPAEAVELLDDTLTRIARTGTPAFVIAGNHDSPERIGFGSRLLAASGVHVAGPVGTEPASVLLACDDGPVRIWMLPYADPAVVRDVLGDPSLRGHDEAFAALAGLVRDRMVPGERNVLLAHEFVAGGVETADSERPLTVGGTAQVARERFSGFDYVALGHLHRPQAVGGPALRYAGSLLKYSGNECGHTKSVTVVELGEAGAAPEVREVSLPVLRDVRTVRGALRELVDGAPPEGRQDYVFALLTDEGPIFDAMGLLRSVYPNCIGFERDREFVPEGQAGLGAAELRTLDLPSLFSSFFEYVTGEAPDQAELAEFVDVADAVHTSQGEA